MGRKVLTATRRLLRAKHYSGETEKAYVAWVRRFMRAYHGRDPRDLGAEEVNAFLTRLAVEDSVSASTQNQAAAALVFLYREGYKKPLPDLSDVIRASAPRRLPVVLTQSEVRRRRPALRCPQPVTPSDIRSPPISWKSATIFARFRSFWAIGACAPP